MSDLAVVKHLSSEELRRWRVDGALRARRNPYDFKYATSPGAVVPTQRQVQVDAQGQGEMSVPGLGRPKEPRELAERMYQIKLAQLQRVRALGREQKLQMVQHFRVTRPGLVAGLTDDEAVAKFDELLRQEAEATAQRAMIAIGRHKPGRIGGW